MKIKNYIDKVITEELQKVRLKESTFKRQGNEYVSSNGLTVKFKKVGSYLYADIFITAIPEKPLKRLSSEPVSSVKAVLEWADSVSKKFDFSKIKDEEDWNALGRDVQDKIYTFLQSGNALASRLRDR